MSFFHPARRFLSSRLGLCLILILAFGVPAKAEDIQSLPRTVTIDKLLRIVREKSPRFAAMRTRIERAKADVVGAGVLPNPRFTYGHYQLASPRNTMYEGNVQEEVTLEVPVLIAGQRGARVAAAEKRVEATEAEIEAEFAKLTREVWGLFVKLLAGRARVTILEQAAQDMEYLRSIVTSRKIAGLASSYDVLRIGVEAKSVETQLENARSELTGTAGKLGTLLGLPGWRPEAVGNFAPLGIPVDPKRLWASAEENNPELEAARRELVAADAGLEQARRERWPIPSFQVGTTYTGRPYGMAAFVGLSVDLPIFDRGQGGMARAAAEKQTILARRELLALKTRAELDRALELLTRRRESRTKFERDVLAKLPDLRQMAESAYRLGRGTLLELLDASRSRTEAQLTSVELIQAEMEAELDVLKASGLLVKTLEEDAAPR